MNSQSINKARFGFAYQYKFALLKILQYLSHGQLRKAFIDYSFSDKNYSIDILLHLNNENLIYEIKTGKNFIENNTLEMGKVLKSINNYCNKNKVDNIFIVMPSPQDLFDFPTEYISNWYDLQYIKNPKIKTDKETPEEKAIKLYKKFKFSDIDVNQDTFNKFVKSINYEFGPEYKKRNEIDQFTDLEDKIIACINDFCSELDIITSEIEIPSWSIALELLEFIQKCIEENKDIISAGFLKILCDSLSRRSLIVSHAEYKGKSKEILLKEERDKIKSKIIYISKIEMIENISNVNYDTKQISIE
ncbi:MAG: hypothetical protein A2539_06380 [Elusimicrobia bacterium RIFOXYD2_FULL_34_15]|nr:MAG: hypothetical protein A2539_06380 [Elusimicrobia bacterium RIFOXYD2_FULL_34_15]